MKSLRKAIRDYFELRRSLGFKVQREETRVRQFLAFLGRKKTLRITTKLALEFATQCPELSPRTQAGRLSAVRGFARYWCSLDPTTEIPAHGLLRARPRRARPYIYTIAEIRQILEAAQKYPWRTRHPDSRGQFQAWVLPGIFGLLAVTGMRVGEVLDLQPQALNWSEGLLTIHGAKFGKSRLIPLHRSTLKALATYVKHRDKFFAQRPGVSVSHFFVTSRGRRITNSYINNVFRTISQQVGLRAPGVRFGPRLHDLRHRFAVVTLLRWYRRGEPVDRLLPVLSTYLGHTDVSGTYWYLTCTPELMAAAGKRLEQRWKGAQ